MVWAILPLHLGDVTVPASHPLAGSDGAIYGFAVRSAAGVVLFETGVGTGYPWIEAHYRPRHRSLTAALAAHGIRPDAIVAAANSHLH
jgi:N-acyl homoserine lactone hydrolase